MRVAERLVFSLVGILLFLAGLILAFRSVEVLFRLAVGPASSTIPSTATFLDLVLLILMIAALAYTALLSLRGSVLSPEPFLIVGLIAVIRRILVITVQEVQGKPVTAGLPWLPASTVELATLTVVVIAFVFAIHLFHRRDTSLVD